MPPSRVLQLAPSGPGGDSVPLPAEKPATPQCWTEGEVIEGSSILLRCYSRGGTSPLAYQWAKLADGYGGGRLPSGTIQGGFWRGCAHPGRFPGGLCWVRGILVGGVSLSVSACVAGCPGLCAPRYVGGCVHLCSWMSLSVCALTLCTRVRRWG